MQIWSSVKDHLDLVISFVRCQLDISRIESSEKLSDASRPSLSREYDFQWNSLLGWAPGRSLFVFFSLLSVLLLFHRTAGAMAQ
jgi:hypothetical protein